MVTVFYYTPVNTKQFDGLNIDGLARKCQKRQNFLPSKFSTIRYMGSIPANIHPQTRNDTAPSCKVSIKQTMEEETQRQYN